MLTDFYITSLIVGIETLLVVFFVPSIYEGAGLNVLVALAVFLVFLYLFERSQKSERPLKVDRRFLAGHIMVVLFFGVVFYAAYTVSYLPEHPVRATLADAFHIAPASVNLPFKRFGMVVLIALCHFTLSRALYGFTQPVLPYALSFLMTFAGIKFVNLMNALTKKFFLQNFLWETLKKFVATAVYSLLKITGFHATCDFDADPDGVARPLIGTDRFNAFIDAPCSGMEGMTAFLIGFCFLAAVNWKKLDKKKMLAALPIGIAVMTVTNILRVYVLVLIGHYVGAKQAVNAWHGPGSFYFYIVVLVFTLFFLDRWMTAKPSGKQ